MNEDLIMQLTKQVIIKAKSIADARSKVAKFVKRVRDVEQHYVQD